MCYEQNTRAVKNGNVSALLSEYDVDEPTAKDGIDKFLETARGAALLDE